MQKFRLKNQLSLINEDEDEDLNLTEKINNFETQPQVKHNNIQQQKNCTKSNGLDRFITFLDQSQTNSSKKLKPLPNSKKTPKTDQLNPQNQPRPRPNSALSRNSLNKFTEFLKSHEEQLQQKAKVKKQRKVNGLNKFMQTLNIAETVKQEKNLSNIVSGLLALSQTLPHAPGKKQKHRYLINQQKFAEIRPKAKQSKVRSHSASVRSGKGKEAKKLGVDKAQKGRELGMLVIQKLQIGKEEINEKAWERKIQFFENINESKSLRVKVRESGRSDFAFIN